MMRFQVLRSKLQQALQAVQRATVQKPVQPILSQVLIEAHTGPSPWNPQPVPHLVLLATDLDWSIRVVVEADVQQAGSATISARFLAEILSKLPTTEVTVSLDFDAQAQQAKLAYCDGEFAIRTMSADEFPSVAEAPMTQTVSLPTKRFLRAIQQTVFSAASQEIHNVLSGVSFKLREGQLELAATDGSRLAQSCARLDLEGASTAQDLEVSAIIPAKTLNEFYKLVHPTMDQHPTVELAINEGQIYLMSPTCQVISRLLDGQYPRYEQLIPKDQQFRVFSPRAELIAKLELTALSASDRNNIVKFAVSDLGALRMSANRDDSECFNQLHVRVEGGALEVAFNYRYVLDALRVMETDTVVMETNGPLAPSVFRPYVAEDATPETSASTEHLSLVMPVQLR